jgi:hypothetical protein
LLDKSLALGQAALCFSSAVIALCCAVTKHRRHAQALTRVRNDVEAAFDGVRRYHLPMKDSPAGKAISVGKIKPRAKA